MYLLDVNVLVPLFWPAHEFHRRARGWFDHHAENGWATCPFTQAAFVRLISNPSFSRDALTAQNALALLDSNLVHPHHHFWPEEISLKEALAPLRPKLVGHRQITDAYLLGLTIFRKGKLATFDSAISSLLPKEKVPEFIQQL